MILPLSCLFQGLFLATHLLGQKSWNSLQFLSFSNLTATPSAGTKLNSLSPIYLHLFPGLRYSLPRWFSCFHSAPVPCFLFPLYSPISDIICLWVCCLSHSVQNVSSTRHKLVLLSLNPWGLAHCWLQCLMLNEFMNK